MIVTLLSAVPGGGAEVLLTRAEVELLRDALDVLRPESGVAVALAGCMSAQFTAALYEFERSDRAAVCWPEEVPSPADGPLDLDARDNFGGVERRGGGS